MSYLHMNMKMKIRSEVGDAGMCYAMLCYM